MNYAIIAAGEGSRLRQEGFQSVKPLVKVNGEFLIERLIRIFKANDAKTISIIINEQSDELKNYLYGNDWGVRINLIVKSTPSSLHSFLNIINNNDFEECCLTTVDTIFNEKDFSEYISFFKTHKTLDALMATTKYIDDEKPLYVDTNDNDDVLAFADNNISDRGMIDRVSAGVYCLRKKAIDKADDCINKGISRMRNYQRSLIEAHLNVKSFTFSKVIDIDHLEDIQKAGALLKTFSTRVLCIERYKEYSPNSQNKDSQIINCVKDLLSEQGFCVDCKEETQINLDKEYYPYVISMARNPQVIEKLNQWEKKGSVVINSTLSCMNCYRETQIEILRQNEINIPKTAVVDCNSKDLESMDWLKNREVWVKRGDFQTIEQIDVSKVKSIDEIYAVLQNYLSRGIQTAVISENIEGDIVKFYGISDTDFFFYYYPEKDKFNNEINKATERIVFDEKKFVSMSRKAALCLDLDIYGGDVAIDKDGNFYIIDMNDFPSFSSCKDAAAKNIVERFMIELTK